MALISTGPRLTHRDGDQAMNYVVADAATGKIKRYGSCAERDVASQAQGAEIALGIGTGPGIQVDHVDLTKTPPVPVFAS